MEVNTWDTDVMRDTCDTADAKADSMESQLNHYRKTVENNLSDWSGSASNAFKAGNTLTCDDILENIDLMRAASAYTSNVADKLDEAEDYLASLKI